jgi:hypothetical protein
MLLCDGVIRLLEPFHFVQQYTSIIVLHSLLFGEVYFCCKCSYLALLINIFFSCCGKFEDEHNTSNVGVAETGDWLEKQRCQSSVFQLRMSLEAVLQ